MIFSSRFQCGVRMFWCACVNMPSSVVIIRVAFATALGLPLSAVADLSTVVCTDLHDSDVTRAVLIVDLDAGAIIGLEVVTPDFLWSDPDQPETRRFDAGKTDVSPDLATEKDVVIRTTRDTEGQLRIVDFAVTRPMTLEFEGFRGSLLLHDGFLNNTAYGSLYYTATGNVLSISPLVCKRLCQEP